MCLLKTVRRTWLLWADMGIMDSLQVRGICWVSGKQDMWRRIFKIKERWGSPVAWGRSLWWSWECFLSTDLQSQQQLELAAVQNESRCLNTKQQRSLRSWQCLSSGDSSPCWVPLYYYWVPLESPDHLPFNPQGLGQGKNDNKNNKIFYLSSNNWGFSSYYASF